MKQNNLFLTIVFLVFSACTPAPANTEIPEQTEIPPTFALSTTAQPAATMTPSPTPTLTLTASPTPDIAALRTQGVTDPWIVTTLGTEIPPPWYGESAAFSPDGKFLVTSYSNKISLWEFSSFRKLSEFVILDGNYSVAEFAFSSDSRFLAATASYYGDDQTHLFVWNTSSLKQIFEADLDAAILDELSEYPLHYPAKAIGFIPDSSRLVTANGNTIRIIEMEGNDETITVELGKDMYASDISFPADGRFIYVFMAWMKDNGITSFPPRYQTKYALQIWDTDAHFLWRTLEYLDAGWFDSKQLHRSYLLKRDSIEGTLELMNLENEEVSQLPYRAGRYTITNDNKYIFVSRFEDEEGIEFWTTDSWRMIYRFQPECPNISDISRDNRYVALVCSGQVTVYDLGIITLP